MRAPELPPVPALGEIAELPELRDLSDVKAVEAWREIVAQLSYERGQQEGLAKGHEAGKQKGLKEGLVKGHEAGWQGDSKKDSRRARKPWPKNARAPSSKSFSAAVSS